MLKCICIYSHVSDRNRGLALDFVRLKKGFIPWKIRKSSKMPDYFIKKLEKEVFVALFE